MVDPMPLIGGDPALLAAYPNNTASLPGCASPINLCRDAAACPVRAKRMLCISNAFTAIRPSHHPPMTFADGSGGCPHCLGHLMADRQGGSLSNAVEMLQCSYQWWIFGAPSRFRSARAVTGRNGQNTYSVPLVLGSAVCFAALPGGYTSNHRPVYQRLKQPGSPPQLTTVVLCMDHDVVRPSDCGSCILLSVNHQPRNSRPIRPRQALPSMEIPPSLSARRALSASECHTWLRLRLRPRGA